MNINGVLLAEPPAAADRLVVRLVTVGQPNEHHLMALLEVHAEPGDGGLRDEDPHGAVLECFECFSLVVGRPGAFDVDSAIDERRDSVGFVVQSAPHDPLAVAGGNFGGAFASCVECLAAHLGSATDPAEVSGKQLAVGDDLDVDDFGFDVERRQVVSVVGVASVRRPTQRHRPRCHPLIHGPDSVTLWAPADLVMNEEGGEHLIAWHDAEKLSVIAELGNVVGCGRGGARQPVWHAGKAGSESLPSAAFDVLED